MCERLFGAGALRKPVYNKDSNCINVFIYEQIHKNGGWEVTEARRWSLVGRVGYRDLICSSLCAV